MKSEPTHIAGDAKTNRSGGSMGGNRAVIEAACTELNGAGAPTLAVVLETTGSTYVCSGAIALFAGSSQTGWLSGGCLEPEIARRAAQAASSATIEWMEVDTQDDEAVFAGSAVGCRGRLRLTLLPLQYMQGWPALASRWLDRRSSMQVSLSRDGQIRCSVGHDYASWRLPVGPQAWELEPGESAMWEIDIAPPPSIIVFGAGPEATMLLPLLRSMGWMTTVVERRERWLGVSGLADCHLINSPAQAPPQDQTARPFAALVMHHNFELDLEALLALAEDPPPFIGLLGPRRRRDDLFKLMPESARERLVPHLHSPVGMDLGGRGPEAIALSIAAQLQSRLHGR